MRNIGAIVNLMLPDHTERLDDLKILPMPCCASWSKTDLHCPFHSRPRWEFENPPITTNDGKHSIGCVWGSWPWYKCPSSPDGEHHFQYVWLGWPGTWCVYCKNDDRFEECLMRHCGCMCHHLFWKNYWNIAMRDIGVEIDGNLSEL